MTRTHIPVLAGELIDLLDPQPGETAVDCTFGGGGHARLIAERIGPAGTLIGIDRDPLAEERFAELSAEVACQTRFIRADFATALERLIDEHLQADLLYMDLGAGGHPARRTFQALRIAVNDELGQLEEALPLAWSVLRPGGRFAAISFHSLEDRRVKRFLAQLARGCICPPELPVCVCGHDPEAELLSRRAIAPTAGEVASNPRSKSAHLRVARKLEVQP